MSENENIEAKLCSYVEGDLDAAGRAEIEKYLLTHPQYRPLIQQLSRTRGLLRELPRESAPAELLETLSGQIERSALLDDDDSGSMQIRSGRFPQLAALAAVLLLTAGLAAVIYRVLPSNKSQPELALLKAAPQPTTQPQNMADDMLKQSQDMSQIAQAPAISAATATGEAVTVTAAPVASPVADAATAPALANDQMAAAEPAPALTLQPPATTSPAIAMANGADGATLFAGGTSISNAASPQQQLLGPIVSGDATQLGQNMYVTLRATDAKAADARVTQYLNDNGIQFESQSPDARSRISSGPLPALTPSGSLAVSGSVSAAATAWPGTASDQITRARGAASEFDATADRRMVVAKQSAAESAYAAPQAPLEKDGAGHVIIARNLTPDQARRLTSDLAVKITPADLNLVPSPQPVAMDEISIAGESPLQTGQRVRIIARDSGLPGVEAMNEPQTIDAEGNLTLPLVGKVKAAGLTQAELAQKIPQAYRDAKSPTAATWTIDRLATTLPTTQPNLSLTPTLEAGASPMVSSTTAPIASAVDKDRQTINGLLGGSGGGGSGGGGFGGGFGGGGGGGAMGGAMAAQQTGIDVTIRVVGQSIAASPPTTQQLSTPAAANFPAATPAQPVITEPAATMPTSAPAP